MSSHPGKDRYIAHVDMDAFFASVEQRDNPGLRGRPVVVGADPAGGSGRGVVSACSYEARRFGIRSAMPISKAYRRCPEAVFLPVDMKKYAGVSGQVLQILCGFTPVIEQVSIDEAFLDLTGSWHLFGSPEETCRIIKRRILGETGLTASVGLGPNKFTAKIASDLEKPDGLVIVEKAELESFLEGLDISRMWGVGEKTLEVMRKAGIRSFGDVAGRSREEMAELFGKSGERFRQLSRGIDERKVEPASGVKSVSNEVTFNPDISGRDRIMSAFLGLSEKVAGRLRRKGLKARTVTVKIRLDDFRTFTRSSTLGAPVDGTGPIYGEVKKLYGRFSHRGRKVRLAGVKVSNFPGGELDLSTDGERKDKRLEEAADRLREKFGRGIIRRAGSGEIN